jgi:adenylate kinase family enzyme
VIGCGGAGKTTVASALAEHHDLPLVQADPIVHPGGGPARPEAEWQPELKGQADGEAWVIDAMKLSLLEHRVERAELVVWLDLPRRWCYLGVAQRADRWRDLRNGEFMRWIWDFPRKARPRIAEILDRHRTDTEIVVLRSRREIHDFLTRPG